MAIPISEPNNLNTFLYILLTLILLGLGYVYWKSKRTVPVAINSNLIQFGDYKFDKRNMLLFRNDEKTDLTSKEADLLLLLYTAVNEVVERDVILNSVWGDEGDYVGRTLDVFISKLRKKIAADEKLKIVNIRGIGYKFIVNEK
jgi:DNA-binding response OmpR family regulator